MAPSPAQPPYQRPAVGAHHTVPLHPRGGARSGSSAACPLIFCKPSWASAPVKVCLISSRLSPPVTDLCFYKGSLLLLGKEAQAPEVPGSGGSGRVSSL